MSMQYQTPESVGEQSAADMRVIALGQAIANLDFVYAPKPDTVVLPRGVV